MRERALRYCIETFTGKQNECVLRMIFNNDAIDSNVIFEREQKYNEIDLKLSLHEQISHTLFFDFKRMSIIIKNKGMVGLLKIACKHYCR